MQNIKCSWNLIDDKKVTCAKNNRVIHTVLLVFMSLLLFIVISVDCYFYYTRDWIKKEYALSYLTKNQ